MHPLDNPAWNALIGVQREMGLGNDLARRFHPEISPIAALADPSSAACWDTLADLIEAEQTVGVLGYPADAPHSRLTVPWHDTFAQMTCSPESFRNPASAPPGLQMRQLTIDDGPAMVALARATEPGPMEIRTVTLGRYLGIFDEQDGLVAMAGERMRLEGFVETSGVCTDPRYRGRQYARVLVSAIAEQIVERGETTFLHVRQGNPGAAAIYEKLGFSVRATFEIAGITRRLPTAEQA